MAMAVTWLLAVPVGLIFFIYFRITAAKKRGDIHFEAPEGAGSWKYYIQQIRDAKRQPAPHPAHLPLLCVRILRVGSACRRQGGWPGGLLTDRVWV